MSIYHKISLKTYIKHKKRHFITPRISNIIMIKQMVQK